MTEPISIYSKTHPFLASLIHRHSLCKGGSSKNIMHVVLNLKGSNIQYQVGDSVAIFGTNDDDVVENTLKAMRASGNEEIVDKHGENRYSLRDFFLKKANLANVPRKLIVELASKQTNSTKKERLDFLLHETHKETLKEYQASHEVWDTLAENAEVSISPQELCHMLQPLLPRFYSIASSWHANENEVHLTVAELIYETNTYIRRGVCTHYLCNTAPLNENLVPIYIQPSNGFTLPEDDSTPIIMIGPGTGVAPYRGFMQERQIKKAKGLNWLIFGEWHSDQQFFYEDYWLQLVNEGLLKLDTAFSRDQEHKIYVQHRMLEKGGEFFEWLEKGAYVYVCGDAHRMAKDVDLALHQIIETHGNLDQQAAKEYVKKLKAAKRYLRDVY